MISLPLIKQSKKANLPTHQFLQKQIINAKKTFFCRANSASYGENTLHTGETILILTFEPKRSLNSISLTEFTA